MAEPLVSIILGFYNQRPDFLRATIRSVLAQTYQNFDLVVSDNHSTNGSSKVLDEFSDPRMRVIRPPQHVAMVPHFAFAAQHAKGEFISFLASDDLVSPDWLEALVPMFDDRPDVVFGFGEIANFPFEDPDQIRFLCREGMFPTGIYSAEQLLPLIFPFNRASSWMVGDLIRIDAYRQTAGNNFLEKAGIAYSGDHALSLRLLEIGSAAYVNKVVAKHRSWGTEEGKVDGLRYAASVSDAVKLYEMLERSSKLAFALANHHAALGVAKRNKARMLTLGLFEAIATKTIEPLKISEAKVGILTIYSSPSLRTALAFCNTTLAPAWRAVLSPAKKAYAAGIGRALNWQGVDRKLTFRS